METNGFCIDEYYFGFVEALESERITLDGNCFADIHDERITKPPGRGQRFLAGQNKD